ncbi:hypothetical protein L202_06694 [Cryptococcus amylolentus CBS 6039]|uniref:Uncharacterized protein n=1 Tax=Cryptococcus amylolentus CBS 6039 TaxID=1295533 RepID=A0A1E3HIJ9_9TREE|nr:hypothetical protein L202_06694 [Cryptococcus amylolentus CBS 6039]ODN75566.1 hypothetical protein L202_06694 [Cryptococcus amylolentus CBS 6039]
MLFGTIDTLSGLAATQATPTPNQSLSPAALGQGEDTDGTDDAASHPAGGISSAISVVDSDSLWQTRLSSSFGPVPRARYDALVNALHAPYPRGDSRVQAIAAHRQQLPSAAVAKGQGLSVASLCAVLAGTSASSALGATRDGVLPTGDYFKRSRETFEHDNHVDYDAARFLKRSRLFSPPDLDDNASSPPALSASRSPSPELEDIRTPPINTIALPDIQPERGIKRSADGFDNDVDIAMEPEPKPKQKVQRVKERTVVVPPSRALKRTTTILSLAAPSTSIDRPAIAASARTLSPAPFAGFSAPKDCPTLPESRKLQRTTTTLGQTALRPLPLQTIDMNRPPQPSRRALQRTTSALSLATPTPPQASLAPPRQVSRPRPLKSCLKRYAPPANPPPDFHFGKSGQTWPGFTFFCPIPRSRRKLSDEEKRARQARRDLKANRTRRWNPETGLKEFLPRRVPGAEPEPVLESWREMEPWSEGKSSFKKRTPWNDEVTRLVMGEISLDDVTENMTKLSVQPIRKKVVTWGGCETRLF